MKRRGAKDPDARLVKVTREKVLRWMRTGGTLWNEEKKTWVLYAYRAATGSGRTHAIVQLRGGRGRKKPGARRECSSRYGCELNEPLHLIWRAASYCCAELLCRHIGEYLAQLTTYGHLQLAADTRVLFVRMS